MHLTIQDPHLLSVIKNRRLKSNQVWQKNLLEGMITARQLFLTEDRARARMARDLGMKHEAETYDRMADEHSDAIDAARARQQGLAKGDA